MQVTMSSCRFAIRMRMEIACTTWCTPPPEGLESSPLSVLTAEACTGKLLGTMKVSRRPLLITWAARLSSTTTRTTRSRRRLPTVQIAARARPCSSGSPIPNRQTRRSTASSNSISLHSTIQCCRLTLEWADRRNNSTTWWSPSLRPWQGRIPLCSLPQ